MSNIDKAAEHLGANALKMIKLILLKHDAAIIEASQEAIVAAVLAEREACAKVAELNWRNFKDTKDAHERLSPTPFQPDRFGFDHAVVEHSKRIAEAIRLRGQL